MSCLVQEYTIFLNLADNHYEQDFNEILITNSSTNSTTSK